MKQCYNVYRKKKNYKILHLEWIQFCKNPIYFIYKLSKNKNFLKMFTHIVKDFMELKEIFIF